MSRTIICEFDEEALNKQIFEEFGKTAEDLNEFIDIIRKWAEEQPHFPETPNTNLLRYALLSNKFSIEKAKQKLDMYYTIRSLMPELYASQPLSPEIILQSKVVYIVVLPKPTPDMKRIVYSRVNPNYGSDFFNHEQTAQVNVNVTELLIEEDKCYSFHIVCDWASFQFSHITKFNPMIHKKGAIIAEKVFSNRIASIYIVNVPKFLETFINTVIKPVFNQKIRDRIHVHSNTDILLEVFGKSLMPKDIGGEQKSLEELNNDMLRKYEEKKDRFEVLRTLRVNESLRPQKLVNDDLLGYYGNFKKINVD